MRAIDTNILARLVLNDDRRQAAQAAAMLREPTWIALTVWLELGWVLGKRLGMQRETISEALVALLTLDTVHTADRDGMLWAVDRFRAGADWADMVHLVAVRGIADRFATFDRDLSRAAGSSTPPEIETIA